MDLSPQSPILIFPHDACIEEELRFAKSALGMVGFILLLEVGVGDPRFLLVKGRVTSGHVHSGFPSSEGYKVFVANL